MDGIRSKFNDKFQSIRNLDKLSADVYDKNKIRQKEHQSHTHTHEM